MDNLILVVSNKVARKNSKIDWPDMNYPGSGETILRTLHDVDYKHMKLQLDGQDGPWFRATGLPEGVAFYQKVT